jgi:hypothetical protein
MARYVQGIDANSPIFFQLQRNIFRRVELLPRLRDLLLVASFRCLSICTSTIVEIANVGTIEYLFIQRLVDLVVDMATPSCGC